MDDFMLFLGLAYEARQVPLSLLNDAENRVNESSEEEKECILYKVKKRRSWYFFVAKGLFFKLFRQKKIKI